jgi:hypothetical protein
MATYDDYDGVFFSIQALRMYHLNKIKEEVEFIILDNNPTGKHGSYVKTFVESIGGKYIPYVDKSSSFNKYHIVEHASGDYVLIMDCHVMFAEDAISHLLSFFENNPNCKDLVQGPLLYNDLKHESTHFDPMWRGNMYGIWASNTEKLKENKPFEIPMQGMGVLAFERKNWPQINPHFKGFGGEEGYIAEKFRINGGKNICLPQLKWMHRFSRPNGVPYRNIIEDRVWNYFLGWYEIYRDENHPFIVEMINYFSSENPNINIQPIKQSIKQLF